MPDYIDDPKIARAGGILPGIEPDGIDDPKIARTAKARPKYETTVRYKRPSQVVPDVRAITPQQRGTNFHGINKSRPTPVDRGLANAIPPGHRPAKRAAKTRSSVEAVESNPILKAEITPPPQRNWLYRFVRELLVAWAAGRQIDKDFMPKGSPTDQVRKKGPKKDEEEDEPGPGPNSGPDPEELKKAADLATKIIVFGLLVSLGLAADTATSKQ